MALIRGTGGLCPCPICLVPKEKLSDLSHDYPLRTAEAMQAIVNEANQKQYAEQKEELLKQYALRGVDVSSVFKSTCNHLFTDFNQECILEGGQFRSPSCTIL
jgi:hypothetical protein